MAHGRIARPIWHERIRWRPKQPDGDAAPVRVTEVSPIEIAPDDPLLALLQSATGIVEVDHLALDSPALDRMRANDIKLIVPLDRPGRADRCAVPWAPALRAGLLDR